MVHQSFRMTNLDQSGGQQAVVSVNDGQTLVLQLNPQRSEVFFRRYSGFPFLSTSVKPGGTFPVGSSITTTTGSQNLLTCSFFSFSWM